MSICKVFLTIGFLIISLPHFAHAKKPISYSHAELDKICDFSDKIVGGVPQNCNFLDPSTFRNQNAGLYENILFEMLASEFFYTFLNTHDTPSEELINYWVWQMRQKDYEQEFTGLLRQHSTIHNNIDEFLDLQNRYTMLYRKKGIAFDYIDFTQEERGKLVLDAEDQMAGHSRSLASLLNKIFSNNSPLLTPKFKQAVLKNSRRILQDKRETLRSEADLLVSMKLTILDFFEKGPHEKVKMCTRQQRKLVDIWAQFGKDFSIWDSNQGVIFDSARYRVYLAEEKILDDCILSVYHAALDSAKNTYLMAGMFNVGPSFMRSKKRLNGMEDLLMIETLIRAIDEFFLADQWNRGGMAWKINSDMRNQLKSNVDVLVSVWQERVENFSNSGTNDPVSLYFAFPSELTENFQPIFAGMLIGQWLSQSDLDQLIDQGRAVNFEGDFYLLPQTYAFRKISSVDRLRQFKAVRILDVISK